jgi:hypothetical protein
MGFGPSLGSPPNKLKKNRKINELNTPFNNGRKRSKKAACGKRLGQAARETRMASKTPVCACFVGICGWMRGVLFRWGKGLFLAVYLIFNFENKARRTTNTKQRRK